MLADGLILSRTKWTISATCVVLVAQRYEGVCGHMHKGAADIEIVFAARGKKPHYQQKSD